MARATILAAIVLLTSQVVAFQRNVIVTTCGDLKRTIENDAPFGVVAGGKLVLVLAGAENRLYCNEGIYIASTQSVRVVGGNNVSGVMTEILLDAPGILGEGGGMVGDLFDNDGILELDSLEFNLDLTHPRESDTTTNTHASARAAYASGFGVRIVRNWAHVTIANCSVVGLDSSIGQAYVLGQVVSGQTLGGVLNKTNVPCVAVFHDFPMLCCSCVLCVASSRRRRTDSAG